MKLKALLLEAAGAAAFDTEEASSFFLSGPLTSRPPNMIRLTAYYRGKSRRQYCR
jgi:hypothetical protein